MNRFRVAFRNCDSGTGSYLFLTCLFLGALAFSSNAFANVCYTLDISFEEKFPSGVPIQPTINIDYSIPGGGSNFCGENSYPENTIVTIDVTFAGHRFYRWRGTLWTHAEDNVGYEERFLSPLAIPMDRNISLIAEVTPNTDSPVISRYPINGPHNLGIHPPNDPSASELYCVQTASDYLTYQSLINNECHAGAQDIHGVIGTPVVAAQDGLVSFQFNWGYDENGNAKIYGGTSANVVDANNWEHYYAHLDAICVNGQSIRYVGTVNTETNRVDWYQENVPEYSCSDTSHGNDSQIEAGTLIGFLGDDGTSTGKPHVHYQVFRTGSDEYQCSNFNPFGYLYQNELNACEEIVTLPYNMLRYDLDPPLTNQYTHVYLDKLFDGVTAWPNNAIINYDGTDVGMKIEFKHIHELEGFRVTVAGASGNNASWLWKVERANDWNGPFTVVTQNWQTNAQGTVFVPFIYTSAKVWRVTARRNNGDSVEHILELEPVFND